METYKLRFELLSASTFGRGDGVAGLIDREVEHDVDGLPYLRGRTLKGLLAEECANILFALTQQGQAQRWQPIATRLFGDPGSTGADLGRLRVSDARLPDDLRRAVRIALEDPTQRLTPSDILESLTTIRRQTSMNEHGAPERGSLRSMRVILRGVVFEGDLQFRDEPNADELALLAACILAWRRAGTGRNRGRGRLRAWLCNADGEEITGVHFSTFRQGVGA